ncbi:hypothetical protein V5O48_018557 [Marasmius crinis-equi]|uniref:Uncharacterized protein n=1 Tax=Marasmius crinis-equi TaxID=585013 RepID=A0ABR3EKV1_9AGAR
MESLKATESCSCDYTAKALVKDNSVRTSCAGWSKLRYKQMWQAKQMRIKAQVFVKGNNTYKCTRFILHPFYLLMVTLHSWYRFSKSTDKKKQLLSEAAYPGLTHFLNIAVLTGSGKIEKVGTLNYCCEACQPANKEYMWYLKRFPLARAQELAAVSAVEEDAVKELKKSMKASLRDEKAQRRVEDKAQVDKEKAEQKEREERKAREREEERQALLDIVKDLPKPNGKGKGKGKGKASVSTSSLTDLSPSKSISSGKAPILKDEIESASDWSPPPLHKLVKVWDQELASKCMGKAPAKTSASTSSLAVLSPSKSTNSAKTTTFEEEIKSESDWSPPVKGWKQKITTQTPSSPTLAASSSPLKLSKA